MTMRERYGRFLLVGAMGMAVQLGSLAALNRVFPGHALVISAAALELTVLHNFIWHLRFTWRDRLGGTPVAALLLRFHLSNGLVSLAGNVLLVKLLLYGTNLPLLAANLVSIACCSVLNFCAGNLWAFARRPVRTPNPCSEGGL